MVGLPGPTAEALLDVVARVPAGMVASYGDIARIAGVGGPRQVGAALARYGGGVPWWRVLRADGRPAPQLLEEQRRQLAADGVEVVEGRVAMSRYRWGG
jgi:alkylated DNA nucleotide flippase Atl1